MKTMLGTQMIRVAVRLLVAGAVAFSASAWGQSGDARKLGFSLPLTGNSAKLGQLMMEGATVAVEQINASGGVAGKPLTLVVEDSQALSKPGIDAFRKLVDIDRVDTIITGWTAVVIATAPLADQTKTFLMSASTAAPALRGVSPYFQSSWMFDDETIRLLLPYAKNELKVQKLAIMPVVNDLGVGLSKSVTSEWQKLGLKVVAEESVQVSETNFRSILLKVFESSPDAIYITGSGKQSAQIIRQARDLGYKGVFLSYGAMEDPEMLTIGDRAERSFYSAPVYDPTSASPESKRFVDGFQKKFSRLPNVHQANHYDLVYIYKAAVEGLTKQGKPITGTNVRDYVLSNLTKYEGAAGKYVFNPKDGSVLRATVVKTVKDGKFVKLTDLN